MLLACLQILPALCSQVVEIRAAIGKIKDPLPQPGIEILRSARPVVILRKSSMVAIIIALNRRGVSSAGHMDHSQRLDSGSQYPVRIALDHLRRHDLFSGIYDAMR